MAKKIPKKRNALGRGLGALLGDSPVAKSQLTKTSSKAVSAIIGEISVDEIEANPFQPRTHFDKEALEELSESIKTQGIIQPITVRKLNDDKYQLISGERRLQASKLAGLKSIPAYIRTANDQQMLEMALIENIQRENLNAIEIALSYQRLLSECNLKQEELGDRVGKKRATVNNYLRLLKLPPDIQIGLRDKKISMGHARALITVESVDIQLDIYGKIIREDLSVRKTEGIVRTLGLTATEDNESIKKPDNELSYGMQQMQSTLSSHFGTKIALTERSGGKGEMKIPYNSTADLNRILEILGII